MGKFNRSDSQVVSHEEVAVAAEQPASTNFSIEFRRDHPGDRVSFGIKGVPGIVVFDKGLFADPANIPTTLTFNVPLQLPRVTVKADKLGAKASKDAERAAKAQEKLIKALDKVAEREAKATAALAKAQERAAAANAKLAAAAVTTSAQA